MSKTKMQPMKPRQYAYFYFVHYLIVGCSSGSLISIRPSAEPPAQPTAQPTVGSTQKDASSMKGSTDGTCKDQGSPLAEKSKPSVVIDFCSLQFPPLVPKLGVNSVWNEQKEASLKGLEGAGAANMSMGAGLLEFNLGHNNQSMQWSLGPLPLMYRDSNNAVAVRGNQNLEILRNKTRDSGLINFLQIAGTVTANGVFTTEPTLASSEGNFYPLPIFSQRQEYANALARFVNLLIAQNNAPTIAAFWQEPTHTLGLATATSNGRPSVADTERNIADFIEFYDIVATEIRKLNLDLPLGAFQLNASQGIGTNGIDGAEYKPIVDRLLKRESDRARSIPIDYFTIQNYKGEKTPEIIQNARFALMNNRFSNVPILMNEFQPSKTGSNEEKYNSSEGIVKFLKSLQFTFDQADVSHIVASDVVTASKSLRIVDVLQRIGKLPLKRASINLPSSSGISGIASSSDGQIGIVLWNEGTAEAVFDLELLNLPGNLSASFESIAVELLTESEPMIAAGKLRLNNNRLGLSDLKLKPNEILFIANPSAATIPKSNLLVHRHNSFFQRVNPLQSPLSTSAYDSRRNAMILATGKKTVSAFGGLVFSPFSRPGEVPATNKLVLNIRRHSSKSEPRAPLLMRLDFLVGNASIKTLFLGSESASFSWQAANMPDWIPTAQDSKETPFQNLAHTSVSLDLSTIAPTQWLTQAATARPRLQLSGILMGSEGGSLADVQIASE